MTSVLPERRSVNGRQAVDRMLGEASRAVEQAMTQWLNQWLAGAVTLMLGRVRHERRAHVRHGVEQQGYCQHCQTHESRRFSRNGYRLRTLLTSAGALEVRLPRVRCVCGGSVRLDFGELLAPYQRLDATIEAQLQHWAALRLSLREMQAELSRMHIGPLGLRTLNVHLRQLAARAPQQEPLGAPPILQIDAIWVTLVLPNGVVRRDRNGRRRTVRGRFKRPILIALGVWPERGRREILAWRLAASEAADAWLDFLSQLEAAGLRGEQGLQLIIHDGGSGLQAALRRIYFGAAEQRCLFHKLRNIWRDITAPEYLSPKQRLRYRRTVFKHFQAIWQAHAYATALRRYLQVVRRFRTSQPQAVATLRRDFRLTLTYYQLEDRFPPASRHHLRTTSRLERFNRRLRRRFRAAGAYPSTDGLLAAMAQEVRLFNPSLT